MNNDELTLNLIRSTRQNGSPRPLAHVLYDLAQPIPKRHLKQKPASGKSNEMLTYCPWHRTIRILSYYTNGFWEYHVENETIGEKYFMMRVSLMIETREGYITRHGTGIESLSKTSYGDFQSNAESMALRRACAKFGLGLDLYDDDLDHPNPVPSLTQDKERPSGDSVSGSNGEVTNGEWYHEAGSSTDTQLDRIRALASKMNVNDDETIIKGINERVVWITQEIDRLEDLSFNNAALAFEWMAAKDEDRPHSKSDNHA